MPDPGPNPRRAAAVPLLERDDLTPPQRRRIGLAAAGLLSAGLAGVAAIGALGIWHLVRRGRLIRARLDPPRDVRLPDLGPTNVARPPERDD